jgi:hypothetical protein
MGYPKSRSFTKQALRNVFGASFLAIAGLLLVLATLISIVSCVLPFWFKLTLRNQVFDDDRPPHDIYVDTGLFFMDKDKFINLLMIDKASSVQLMPGKTPNKSTCFYIYSQGFVTIFFYPSTTLKNNKGGMSNFHTCNTFSK